MRILYLYPSPVADELIKVNSRSAPSDRMYGLVELRELGHQVDFADERFLGTVGKRVRWLRRHSLNVCDWQTLRKLRRYDVVIVKDEFSPLITAACRMAGTRVVYIDSLFQPPQRFWKHGFYKWNIRHADGVIAYSRTQIDVWRKRYDLRADALTFMPYAIDVSFYAQRPAAPRPRPYVLSVGRDMGRDFPALLEAMRGMDVDLKLVTLPYLLRGVNVAQPWIQCLQRIPYEELFELYAGAAAVVIPLKPALTYPSGIRGLLEAMALGRPTVCTRTPVLEEYVADRQGVLYVDAADPAGLRAGIASLVEDRGLGERIAAAGRRLVEERYDIKAFAQRLDGYLRSLA